MSAWDRLSAARQLGSQLAWAAASELYHHRRVQDSPDLKHQGLLFVIPGLFLNLDLGTGPISDKAEPLRLAAVDAGIEVSTLVRGPYGSRPDWDLFTGSRYFGTSSVQLGDWVARSARAAKHYATSRGDHRSRTRRALSAAAFQETELWRRTLDRSNPAVIAGISLQPGLCQAARERGVPTLEIQHGLMGQSWALYLNTLPTAGRPTHLLTWDRVYNDVAEAAGMIGVSIGYPPLAESQGTDPGALGPSSAPDAGTGSDDIGISGHADPTVLVTLQYNFRDSMDPFGMVSTDVGAAIAALRSSRPDIRLAFRLHPIWWQRGGVQEAVAWLRSTYPGCSVSIPRNTPILSDIQATSAVLTHHSSTVFEAAMLGIPSFVVSSGFEMSEWDLWTDEKTPTDASADASFEGFHMDLPAALEESGLIVECAPDEFPDRLGQSLEIPHRPYRPAIDDSFVDLVQSLAGRSMNASPPR